MVNDSPPPHTSTQSVCATEGSFYFLLDAPANNVLQTAFFRGVVADFNNGVTISYVIPDSLNGCRTVGATMLFSHASDKLLGCITLNSRSTRGNNRRVIKQ